ncbi:MAG TPA: type II toxin-antitoxin system VapC family toxin [Anaerolineae bacterium]|nr:type II toxin-antitoxin system VapC family toxin [Anaerolineae bacterium]
MAGYLLDTNHVSPRVVAAHPLRRRVLSSLQAGDTFSISVPTLTELLFGISLLPRAKSNLAEWENLKTRFNYYSIDRSDAEQASALQIALRRRGRQLATVDALIAAVALRYDLILLTTDSDFDAIPDLKQANWLTP